MLPFTEVYRPKKFEELSGIDIVPFVEIAKNPSNIPNLLLVGSPGSGKSSTIKILLEELKPIDYLKINGSDTNGVDFVREKIHSFISSKSSVDGKPKIVWIEETDFFSQAAFAALRSMMEQYCSNSRFICSANFLEKIPEPIQSRFSVFNFNKLNKEAVKKRIGQILLLEKKTLDSRTIDSIIELSNGDLRKAINNLQKVLSGGSVVLSKEVLEELVFLIEEKQWSKIRYEIPKYSPDYIQLLIELENYYFNSDKSVEEKSLLNEIISDGLFKMNFSFNKEICFMAVCSKIIRSI